MNLQPPGFTHEFDCTHNPCHCGLINLAELQRQALSIVDSSDADEVVRILTRLAAAEADAERLAQSLNVCVVRWPTLSDRDRLEDERLNALVAHRARLADPR